MQKIVAALEQQQDYHPTTTFRMADFAEFALKVGPVLGFEEIEVEEMLGQLAAVQVEFTIEDDPLLTMLDDWLLTPRNAGRWLRTAELFNDLLRPTRVNGTERMFPFKDARGLGQNITNLRSTLQALYGYEEQTRGGGVRWMRFNNSGSRTRTCRRRRGPESRIVSGSPSNHDNNIPSS